MLTVDDDQFVRALLVATLSLRNYRLVEASNGDEALEVARRERPSVVLLDVLMPGPDGFEVCRRIKEDPELKGTAVVLVTSRADEVSQSRARQSGADDYVVKPFSPFKLLEVVDGLIAR